MQHSEKIGGYFAAEMERRHLDRHGKFGELKQFAIQRRRDKGMKMPPIEVRRLVPSFDEMTAFLDNHPEVWGVAGENHLRHSLRKMAEHQKTFNSVLHNPLQMVTGSTGFEIRDEVLPMLRHLIET